MTTLRTRSRIPLTVALAAVLLIGAPLMTGCSLLGTVVNGATGGNVPDIPDAPDLPGDVEPDPQFASIPATFPSEIPLFDGQILQGIDVGTGWSLIFQANDIVPDFTTAADLLEDAGYEAIARSTDGGQGFGNFNNGEYSINLSASDTADYGPVVAYTVVIVG
jgi:hypothetical protein